MATGRRRHGAPGGERRAVAVVHPSRTVRRVLTAAFRRAGLSTIGASSADVRAGVLDMADLVRRYRVRAIVYDVSSRDVRRVSGPPATHGMTTPLWLITITDGRDSTEATLERFDPPVAVNRIVTAVLRAFAA